MAATLLTNVKLLGASMPVPAVQVRPKFGMTGEAASCVLQSTAPSFGPIAIDAGGNRPAIDSATKGYWVHTPKFGNTGHSQRWRFET